MFAHVHLHRSPARTRGQASFSKQPTTPLPTSRLPFLSLDACYVELVYSHTQTHRFIAELVTLSACFGLYKAAGGVTEEIRAPLCRDVTHSPQMFRTTKNRTSRLMGGRKEGLKENKVPVRSSTLMDDNISDGNCDEYQCGC